MAKKADTQKALQRQSLGEPDLFRMKYRDAIRQLVAQIITERADNEVAGKLIRVNALALPENDHERFIQTIENELISLHHGNFARYFVTPQQFADWQKVWR